MAIGTEKQKECFKRYILAINRPPLPGLGPGGCACENDESISLYIAAMRKHVLPVNRSVLALTVSRISEQSVTLRARSGQLEVRAVAPDLFRVRATSAKSFSTQPSWAVSKTEWPSVPTQIRSSRSHVLIQTSKGELGLRLADGAWKMKDGAGKEVFASIPTESGFAKAGCQLTLGLAKGEWLFGLGETTGTFNKRWLIREVWNIDVLGH